MQSNSAAAGNTISRSALSVLFSVVFLDNLGYAIVVPYLLFYALSLGASTLLYGVLLASYSLMSFIFTPIVARLSDRYGRRKILLVALAVSSFSYLLFGVAQALWLLFLARMLAGTTAATVPVAQAYAADLSTPKQRLRYLGLLGAAAGIAFILGPAIGGTLSDYFGYGVPSFLASALALINLVSTYFRLPEPSRLSGEEKKSAVSFGGLGSALRERKLRLLLVVYFLFWVAFIFMQSSLTPWMLEVFGFGELQTGMVFFYIGAISVFTQAVLLPRISENRSRSSLMLVSLIVLASGLFMLAAVVNVVLLFAVAAVVSFGFGSLFVTLNTSISVNSPQEAQGGSLGFAWALAALGQTIGPVLAASAFTFGVSRGFDGLVFVVSGGISIAILPLVLKFKRLAEE